MLSRFEIESHVLFFQHCQGNFVAASKIYEEALEMAAMNKKLHMLPVLYIRFSRLKYMVCNLYQLTFPKGSSHGNFKIISVIFMSGNLYFSISGFSCFTNLLSLLPIKWLYLSRCTFLSLKDRCIEPIKCPFSNNFGSGF